MRIWRDRIGAEGGPSLPFLSEAPFTRARLDSMTPDLVARRRARSIRLTADEVQSIGAAAREP
jgi:hypothetical protein